MGLYKISEDAVTGHTGGTNVQVDVLEDNGTTAKIQIQDCGIHLRQGHVHTVPSSALELR